MDSLQLQSCGSCSLCCKILQIEPDPSVDPPYPGKGWNEWCPSCKPGSLPGGCQRYDSRPIACRQFKCVWLASQTILPLPPNIKPSKSHVVLVQSQEDENVLFAFVDPGWPLSHKQEPIRSYLINCANNGGTVVICVNRDRYVMTRGRPTFKLSEDQVQQLSDGRYIRGGSTLGDIQIGVTTSRSPQKVAAKGKFNRVISSLMDTTAAHHDGRYTPRRIPRSEKGYS